MPTSELSTPRRPRLVFSDVDETLITCKSLLDFLGYYLAGRYGPEGASRAARIREDLHAQVTAGLPRADANRAYYRAWRGEPVAAVEEWARRWFAERSAAEGFYVREVAAQLRGHRAEGASIVLVSGSFRPLLDPLAEAVGAGHVLCARLERCGRFYTGALLGAPVIGDEKRRLVRELLARHPHIDPADCYGYGDDPSDLPMLSEVGHAVMVGASSHG
ncbi:HAD family hydrolase [Streptomyces alboniger]|uniref:HAD-IB family hydrolase n=1 Tax=Streptomyces alboniger TaxID=132473 RepID=A0A5J6HKN3_STRAD|nr:HAD-IB family hydrolase [Streptomyces alboniger]QEV20008.1 HAD-IB family hydrolase [Streptomyces alboniger]